MRTPYIIQVLSSEEECLNLFRRVRWSNGVVCPRCGSRNVIRWGRYRDGHRYLCKDCGRTFNDRTGTLFHYSRFSLRTWILIIVLSIIIHVSIKSISWLLDASYMTMYHMFKGILYRCGKSRHRLHGVVEVDELYQNSGLKGGNNSSLIKILGRRPRRRGLKRRGRGNYEGDKVPVFALIQRDGDMIFISAKDVTEETIEELAETYIEPGTTIYTDEYPSYKILDRTRYKHEYVDHSKREYACVDIHINTCEGEFSLLRTFMKIHRGVAKYNMPLYTNLYKTRSELYKMNIKEAVEEAMKIAVSIIILILITEKIVKMYTNKILI